MHNSPTYSFIHLQISLTPGRSQIPAPTGGYKENQMRSRPSSPDLPVRRAPDHFFGRICYPPYHFLVVSAASVVLTCDLNPSNHQKCRILTIRLSLTHVVARVINRHSQGVKTICLRVILRAKLCNYIIRTPA